MPIGRKTNAHIVIMPQIILSCATNDSKRYEALHSLRIKGVSTQKVS